MSRWTIRLFGKPEIWHDETPLSHILSGKTLELLVYLLLFHQRTHHRERLTTELWEDYETSNGLKSLRQAIWKLQTELANYAEPEPLLVVDQMWIGVDPKTDLWLDISHFDKANCLAYGLGGEALTAELATTLYSAVSLYRGDLLEGWYRDWCLLERERMRDVYLNMLGKLMKYCEHTEQYELGVSYGHLILGMIRSHERTHRWLMRLYYLSGDRSRALQQYKQCETFLKQDFAIMPTQLTQDLYQQIKSDNVQAIVPENESERATVSMPEMIHCLQQIQNALQDIRRQLPTTNG